MEVRNSQSLISKIHMILVTFFTDWLNSVSIAKLDTALSNHCDRPEILDILASQRFVLKNTRRSDCSSSYYQWLRLRNIRINNFNLSKFLEIEISEDVLCLLQRSSSLEFLLMGMCPNLLRIVRMRSSPKELHLVDGPKLESEITFVDLCIFLHGLQHLELQFSHILLTDQCIFALIERCPNLLSLRFAHSSTGKLIGFTDAPFRKLSLTCKQLIHLDLPLNVKLDTVVCCLQNMPYLEYLNVVIEKHGNTNPTTITDDLLKSSPFVTSHLSYINVAHCVGITNQFLLQLSKCCSKLKHLSLAYCKNVNDSSLVQLLSSNVHVKTLLLEGCPLVGNSTVSVIAVKCVNIRELDISSCKKITDATMIQLGRSCTQLVSLHLSGCKLLTDISLIIIAENAKQLQSLSVPEMSDIVAMRLCCNYPVIDSLSIEDFSKDYAVEFGNCYRARIADTLAFADSSVNVTLNHVDNIRQFMTTIWALNPRLKRLSISNVDTEAEQYKFVDFLSIFKAIPVTKQQVNPSFLMLSLDHVEVDDDAMEIVLSKCPNIASVSLSSCPNITMNTLIAIGRYCGNLVDVGITNFEEELGEGFVAIASGCPALKYVDFSSCESLRDFSIGFLVEKCIHLQYLDVTECCSLTRKIFEKIGQFGNNLKTLSLVGCSQIHDDYAKLTSSLHELHGIYPLMRVIYSRKDN